MNRFQENLLRDYESYLREAIISEKNRLIDCKDNNHLVIALKLFSEYTTNSFDIYCEDLSKAVYEPLKKCFQNLIEHGVEIRVVTEKPYSELESKEIANLLIEANAWRYCGAKQTVPRFAIFDNCRVYVEIDSKTCKAFIMPHISSNLFQTTQLMKTFFDKLWEMSSSDKD